MGWIAEGSVAVAIGESRSEGERHVLADYAYAPLPKRQRVAGYTDYNTSELMLSSSSGSMSDIEFTESPALPSQSNLPSEDEILIQVGTFPGRIFDTNQSHIFHKCINQLSSYYSYTHDNIRLALKYR
jgi:hypothetical protein